MYSTQTRIRDEKPVWCEDERRERKHGFKLSH